MTMKGIVSYGAYVPFNRLQRETIGQALQSRGGKGERAVASYDEDTATMAVEAARNCLANAGDVSVASLYFASAEPPYFEKLNAATVHAALSLPATTRALDLTCSVRAGLTTLLTAIDASTAGGNGLVTVSDIRLGAPEGAAESSGGDGAAAFVVGTENVIAEVVGTYSETIEHMAVWRVPGQRFPKAWEERFGLTEVYSPLLAGAGNGLLSATGVNGSDIAAVVVDSPNPRAIPALAKSLGAPQEAYVDDMAATVGHTGAAHAPMMLAGALDNAKPGDLIAVFSVSDGVDAVLFKVTDAIKKHKNAKTLASQIASKRNDLAYTRYLKWRGILETEPPRRPDPARPAGPPSFRRHHWKFGFIGTECTECGTRHLPPARVCVKCRAVDKMKEVPFANRRGKIRTYTQDRLAYTLQPPMVMAMVDFDDGGRVELEVTDCEPEKIQIGQELEMTFRRLYTADGVHNYFWKARPVR